MKRALLFVVVALALQVNVWLAPDRSIRELRRLYRRQALAEMADD